MLLLSLTKTVKKIIVSLIILIILIAAALVWYFIFSNKATKETPVAEIGSFEECISAGYPVMESYPRQCRTDDGKNFTEDIGNELEKMDLIRIDNPRPNQMIQNPLAIRGEARGFWFFEADFPVKLYDDNGFLLGLTIGRALNSWMTEDFVPFSAMMNFAAPSTRKGRLILEKDNPSDLLENVDELIVPVYFKEIPEEPSDLMTVRIFLNDSRFVNEPDFDCSRTIAVERKVPKTAGVARAAVEALLRGAIKEEISSGFVSTINSGVRIQSLVIENGVARIDFDEHFEFAVGGSCRVAAIRSQIEDTLKHFFTVNEVMISVNGRMEDILQP